jgi:hypothetical protein
MRARTALILYMLIGKFWRLTFGEFAGNSDRALPDLAQIAPVESSPVR